MVSVDDVLELLHSEDRRYALYYLDEQDGPVHVEELAEAVAEMQLDGDHDGGADTQLDRYEISLLAQLPKADTVEFIEYDAADGVVRVTEEPPTYKALLTVAEVFERPA